MPRATDGTLLPDDDWNKLQEYADRFAAARAKGPVDDWEAYLPQPGDPLRRPVLCEDAKIDMEATWREGGRALIETYETLFPEITPVPVDLIVEEYRTRHRDGDKPDLAEYQTRFPDRFAEIEERAKARPPQQSAPRFQSPPPQDLINTPVTQPLNVYFPEGYTPVEVIGRGNFGEVWRAEAPGGIAVAIKIVSQPLDNEAAKRELQALELVKKLQHPKLLPTLAFWIIQNRLVVAMELADCTLRDKLKEWQAKGQQGIPPEELLQYFRDAAEGLDWLHWQGLVHRDIKPENILLKHGYAKVADFGLAKSGITGALVTTSFAGTPAFMPPEMWGQKAGKQSDQYSLAFTYAELRLGRRPLEGGDFLQAMTSALEGTPNLEGLSQPEQTVIRRALAKKPEDRFDSCQDFVEALERAILPDGRTSRRRAAGPAGPTPRLTSGEDISSTERTRQQTDAPAKGPRESDRTLHEESAAKKSAVVWKPPGPAPATGSPAQTILIAIAGLILVGGGAIAAYVFFSGNGGKSGTSQEQAVTTSSADQPPPSTTRPPPPPPPDMIVLDGFARAKGAKPIVVNGKPYASRILFRSGKPAETTFLLIQPETGRPYYLAENKITNAAFAAFRQEKGAPATAWRDLGADLPAVLVTWKEAQDCAKWMDGRLPSPGEYDDAAGFRNPPPGRTGPFEQKQGLGIGVNTPLAVTRDHGDVSPKGVRDLSGNGREWTSERFTIGEEEFVILRGRMYTLSTPLTYADLARQQDRRNAQTQRPYVANAYTGFRVAIDIR